MPDIRKRFRYTVGGPIQHWMLPAGLCSHCGKCAIGMHQVGRECRYCERGTYLSWREFEWEWCACRQGDPFCKLCRGRGVVPVQNQCKT